MKVENVAPQAVTPKPVQDKETQGKETEGGLTEMKTKSASDLEESRNSIGKDVTKTEDILAPQNQNEAKNPEENKGVTIDKII